MGCASHGILRPGTEMQETNFLLTYFQCEFNKSSFEKNEAFFTTLLKQVMKSQDSPLELSREVLRMAVPKSSRGTLILRRSLIKTIDLFKPNIDTKSSRDNISLLWLHFFF